MYVSIPICRRRYQNFKKVYLAIAIWLLVGLLRTDLISNISSLFLYTLQVFIVDADRVLNTLLLFFYILAKENGSGMLLYTLLLLF